MTLALDHLVVGAATLDAGRVWCARVLGAEPLVGGRHAFMGTHNLVLRLDDPRRALYLEILAIDPDASDPRRPRWFDMDGSAIRWALAIEPRLIAWVARSDAIDGDRERLLAAGLDPGPVVAARRDTPTGELRWRITIPPDGARLARGAVPMLIAWDTPSPAASLPASDVSLERLTASGVPVPVAPLLEAAGLDVTLGPGPALRAVLSTPVGSVEFASV